MRFVDIVASRLVSGSYYNWGCVGNSNATKTSKATWHAVRTSQRTLRAWSKNRSLRPEYICVWLFIVG